MKLSKVLVIVNIIVLAIAAVIAVPSINTNIGGQEINFDTAFIKNTFNGRFANINVANSRDFMHQQLFTLELPQLNTTGEEESPLTDEQKEEIFNRNFAIVKQRMDYMGFGDYDMNQVVTEDGRYFIEIKLPEDQLNASVLGTLLSQGDFVLYEYDEDYEAPEEGEDTPISFLDGKKPSELLTLSDAVQIKHYYNADILPNGGWAINIDFGDINADKVALVAAGSENFNDFYQRLWIVQNQIPVAIQIAPILRDVNNEPFQSEVTFASFISQDDPNSFMITKALASSLKSPAIDTTILINDAQILNPLYGDGTIENLKVFFIAAFVLLTILSVIFLRSKGIILAGASLTQLLLTVAIAKFASASLTVALILGIIGGIVVFIMTNLKYLTSESYTKLDNYERYRKDYWIVSTILLIAGVIGALVLNSLLLNSVVGFIISLISSLIVLEMTLKVLVPMFSKK